MPGSSENFDLIIRARDESAATLNTVNQRVGGVSTKLTNMVSASNLAAQSVRGLASGLLGVGGVLGIVALGVAGLKGFLDQKLHAIERLNEALDLNAKALAVVAAGNDRFAGYAREAIRLHDEMTVKTIAETERKLDLAEAGLKELSFLEKAISTIGSLPGHALPNIFKDLSSTERTTEIARLTGALAKLRAEMSGVGKLGEGGPISFRIEHDLEVERAALVKNALAWKLRLEPIQMSVKAQEMLHRGMRTIDEGLKRESTIATDMLRDETLERERIIQESQDRLGGIIQSGMVEASASIINTFLGVRANLAEIFKQMALDFERFFLGAIMQKAAFKLASAALAPTGILGFLGLGKPVAGGGSPVIPASAPRLAMGGGTTVVVQINGDIIGEEQYVRQRVIPQLKRAMEVGVPGPW